MKQLSLTPRFSGVTTWTSETTTVKTVSGSLRFGITPLKRGVNETPVRLMCGVRLAAYLLALGLCASLPALAQGQGQRPAGAGAGGLGGGGAGGGRAVGATGARPYYNNGTVGEAMLSSDPETRRLIVITDDESGQYVSQVITNL